MDQEKTVVAFGLGKHIELEAFFHLFQTSRVHAGIVRDVAQRSICLTQGQRRTVHVDDRFLTHIHPDEVALYLAMKLGSTNVAHNATNACNSRLSNTIDVFFVTGGSKGRRSVQEHQPSVINQGGIIGRSKSGCIFASSQRRAIQGAARLTNQATSDGCAKGARLSKTRSTVWACNTVRTITRSTLRVRQTTMFRTGEALMIIQRLVDLQNGSLAEHLSTSSGDRVTDTQAGSLGERMPGAGVAARARGFLLISLLRSRHRRSLLDLFIDC
mmetsp:Transcript_13146/g.33548  ORF Transcript_13146/g.33548 Transcript_13146/m.33548 type:complete len:271 (+) Transcript_13146:2752-3564(+)